MPPGSLINRRSAAQIAADMRKSFDSAEAKIHLNQSHIEKELLKYLRAQKFSIEQKSEKTLSPIKYRSHHPENVEFNDSLTLSVTSFLEHEMAPFANRMVQLFDSKSTSNSRNNKRSQERELEQDLPLKKKKEKTELQPKPAIIGSNEKEILGFFTRRATEEAKARSVSNWYAPDASKVNEEVFQRKYTSPKILRRSKLEHIDPRSIGIHGNHVSRSRTNHENIKSNALADKFVQMTRKFNPSNGHSRH